MWAFKRFLAFDKTWNRLRFKKIWPENLIDRLSDVESQLVWWTQMLRIKHLASSPISSILLTVSHESGILTLPLCLGTFLLPNLCYWRQLRIFSQVLITYWSALAPPSSGSDNHISGECSPKLSKLSISLSSAHTLPPSPLASSGTILVIIVVNCVLITGSNFTFSSGCSV